MKTRIKRDKRTEKSETEIKRNVKKMYFKKRKEREEDKKWKEREGEIKRNREGVGGGGERWSGKWGGRWSES